MEQNEYSQLQKLSDRELYDFVTEKESSQRKWVALHLLEQRRNAVLMSAARSSAPAAVLRQLSGHSANDDSAARLNHCGAIFGCMSPCGFRVKRQSARAGSVPAQGAGWPRLALGSSASHRSSIA